jgi:hypothetical protein
MASEVFFATAMVGSVVGGGFSAYRSQQQVCQAYKQTLAEINTYTTDAKKQLKTLEAYDQNLKQIIFQNQQKLADLMLKLQTAQQDFERNLYWVEVICTIVVVSVGTLLGAKRLGWLKKL